MPSRTVVTPVAGPSSRVVPKKPRKPRAPRKVYRPDVTPKEMEQLEAEAQRINAALLAARKKFSKGTPQTRNPAKSVKPRPSSCSPPQQR